MGGLGETRTVNLTNYLSVLERAGFDTHAYWAVLDNYRVGGSRVAVVAQGKAGDGQILFPYSLSGARPSEGGQIQGVLRFSQNGGVYEGLMGNNEIVSTNPRNYDERPGESDASPPRLSVLFVAGLFGEGELRNSLSPEEKVLLAGIKGAEACFLGSAETCDFSSMDEAKIQAPEVRRKAEAEKRAAAEQKRLAALNAEFAQLSQGITEAWKLADDIMAWARANDHWYNSISEDRVAGILNPHSYTRTPPANLEQARHNAGVVKKMLDSLIGTREGLESRKVTDGRFALRETSVYRGCPSDYTGTGGYVTKSIYTLPFGIEVVSHYGIPSSCSYVEKAEEKPCRGKTCGI